MDATAEREIARKQAVDDAEAPIWLPALSRLPGKRSALPRTRTGCLPRDSVTLASLARPRPGLQARPFESLPRRAQARRSSPPNNNARFRGRSCLAETEGFEPSIQVLPRCSLSRGVPSTSRPRLLASVTFVLDAGSTRIVPNPPPRGPAGSAGPRGGRRAPCPGGGASAGSPSRPRAAGSPPGAAGSAASRSCCRTCA